MRTDRELLELAAKAAGITIQWSDSWGSYKRDARPVPLGCSEWLLWRPLTDDGDALRLAVKLGLAVEVDNCDDATRVSESGCDLIAKHMHFDGGPEAATRRAIVRAAAEIGAQAAAQQNGESND